MKKTVLASCLMLAFMAGCSPESAGNKTDNIQQNQVAQEEKPFPTDNADWVLKNSDISFTSTKIDKKKNGIEETGQFTEHSALFNKKGQFRMEIDLDSLDTGITIRDQRIKEWMFETEKFTTATITADLNAEQINQLTLNESIQITQPAVLNLHGMTSDLEIDLTITRTAPSALSVSTNKPVILSIENFGMSDGLQKLTEVMGLFEIKPTIPVTFKGEFFRP